MFRWASIMFSSMAVVFFIVTGFAAVVEQGCPDWIPLAALSIARADTSPPSLGPGCVVFYNTLGSWALLCGAGLIVILLVAHLIISAKKRIWGWFITLLVAPPVCFSCGAIIIAPWAGGGGTLDELTISAFCTLIGLLNLLFGIAVLKPTRSAPRASPSAEVPTS